MNIYLFAIASLIIIFPIIYFLPLGLTKKGKLIIITVSFLLAVLGLTANDLFQWWQLALLMTTLVVLSSFLLEKKIRHVLFSEEKEETGEIDLFDQFIEEMDVPAQDDNLKKTGVFKEIEGNDFLVEETVSINEMEIEDSQINILITNDDGMGSIFTESLDEPIITEENEESSLLDEEFITLEKQEIDAKMTDETDSKEEFSYMSELEKLIFDSEEDEEFLDILTHFNSNNTEVAATIEQDQENQERLHTEKPFDESLVLETNENDDAFLCVQSPLEDSSIEAEIMIDDELLQGELLEISQTFENEMIEDTPLIHADIEAHFLQEANEKGLAEEQLQKNMFKTLLAQVMLTKKSSDHAQYEKVLIECMHPKMPKLEFFTFASLLIQHYISRQDYVKLHELLKELEDKYVDYSLILEQVQFLQSYYPSKLAEK